MQELIEEFTKFQSESLEHAPHLFGVWFFNNAESMLEKEKEVMCEFVHDCADNLFSGYGGFEEYYSEKIEGIFDKTFNTKER